MVFFDLVGEIHFLQTKQKMHCHQVVEEGRDQKAVGGRYTPPHLVSQMFKSIHGRKDETLGAPSI